MNRPNTQEGGTSAVYAGSLKRRLKSIPVARISSTDGATISTSITSRLLLKNLNGNLTIHCTFGLMGSTTVVSLIRPAQIPANGCATLQLTPINTFPDAGDKVYLRPVFQDPAGVTTENHPLPQNIPFGWEGTTEADELEFEIIVSAAGWAGTNINAIIYAQVAVEYTGPWWDVKAVNYMLSQVEFSGGPSELPIANSGGG